LKTEFSARFQDFRKEEQLFALFVTPFSIPAESVDEGFQLELIDLPCSTSLKDKFRMTTSLIEFYQNVPQQQLPKIRKQATKVVSMFGSTYVCENLFSAMNFAKPKFRSCLSDESFRNTLRLMATRNFVPDIELIVSQKKHG